MAEEGKGILNGSRNAIMAIVVSAIIGSTGGPLLLVKLGVNPYRADAYTATMAEEHFKMEERRFAALELHVRDHPDVALRAEITQLKSGAAAAKSERAQIIRNQERILDRLDTK